MKKVAVFLFFIFYLLFNNINATLYNPVKEVKTKLIVLALSNISMYGEKDFVLITAKSEVGNKIFILEISPRWFLKEEFFEKVKPNLKIHVIGSLSKENWIVVRKISTADYSVELRTKQGFPLWRVK